MYQIDRIVNNEKIFVENFGEDENIEYVGRAKVGPMHGKESKVFHDQETI